MVYFISSTFLNKAGDMPVANQKSMVRKLLVAVLMVFACKAVAQEKGDFSLIPYRDGKKWGYCDPSGKIIIAPQFTEAGIFWQTLNVVKLDSYYCVIDKKGNIIHKSTKSTYVRSGGRYFLVSEDQSTEQLYDAKGNRLPKQYDRVEGVNRSGYAVFTGKNFKMGVIDSDFNEIIPADKYESVSLVGGALFQVSEPGSYKRGFINIANGNKVPCLYSKLYPPHEGLIMASKEQLFGFIDEQGSEVIPFKYHKACPEGVAPGESYNEYGHEGYNYDGFYGGLAVVIDDAGKSGYIDKKGGTAIPFMFDKAFGFINGYAWVKIGEKWGIINKKGNYVLKPIYKYPNYVDAKELLMLDGFHEGLIAVIIDSLYGYADTTGKLVLPYKYKRAEPFMDGIAPVYFGEKIAFIDRKGKIVIQPKYRWIEGAGQAYGHPFYYGTALAYTFDNKCELIDKHGRKIVPCTFNDNPDVRIEHGIGTGVADGKLIVFNLKGEILYSAPTKWGMCSIYTPTLIHSYGEDCFIDVRRKIHYCK